NRLALHSLPAKLDGPALGLIMMVSRSVTGLRIACSTLEKTGPTTNATLSRSIMALTLVHRAVGFQLVILDDQLGFDTAELTPQLLEREIEPGALLLTDNGRRP